MGKDAACAGALEIDTVCDFFFFFFSREMPVVVAAFAFRGTLSD